MLPNNSIAFQVGETAQVHTGGLLQATPHGECFVSVMILVTFLTLLADK
jgi:hypothetical protein